MNRLVSSTTLLVLALLLLPLGALDAQGTGVVPSSDAVYTDIERLSDFGVLNGVVLGQRPYSRRAIARIARVAREQMDLGRVPRLGDEARDLAEQALQRIESRFAEAAEAPATDAPFVAFVDAASLSIASTDIARRGFPEPHTKPIEATIEPIDQRRLGRAYQPGQTASLEVAHRLEVSDWFALQARERIDGNRKSDTAKTQVRADVLLLSARARVRNVGILVGRQQVTWGQREGLGLFLASDAPVLDQVSLSSDQPFALPGFLRPLGPAQATVLFADLGPSTVRSHSKLLAYKVSVAPNSAVEFGGTFLNHFGGTGARSSSFGDRLVDFLPFIDIFRKHNYSDSTRSLDVDSDKALGMDGRVRLDQLGGITFVGEFLIDDFDVHRLRYFFSEEGSQSLRVIAPVFGTPYLSAQITAKHMGPLTYSHGALLNGSTTRGRLLGDELGPDAKSFGAALRYTPSADLSFDLEGRSIVYSNATYETFYADAAQTDFQVRKIADKGNELREVLIGSIVMRSAENLVFRLRGAGERVRNPFAGGLRRYDYQAQFAIELLQ